MLNLEVQTVRDLLQQHSETSVIIAVDGHSAAGKSTFAATLAAAIEAPTLHGDDFYRVLDQDERAKLTPAQGADRYYDWQRLRDVALQPTQGSNGTPEDCARFAAQWARPDYRPVRP